MVSSTPQNIVITMLIETRIFLSGPETRADRAQARHDRPPLRAVCGHSSSRALRQSMCGAREC
jgi:hypothetical protein